MWEIKCGSMRIFDGHGYLLRACVKPIARFRRDDNSQCVCNWTFTGSRELTGCCQYALLCGVVYSGLGTSTFSLSLLVPLPISTWGIDLVPLRRPGRFRSRSSSRPTLIPEIPFTPRELLSHSIQTLGNHKYFCEIPILVNPI